MLSSASTQRWRNSTVSVLSVPSRIEVVRVEPPLGELADRDQRARQRQRRDDGVDAAAVGQARVDHRRGLVDAAPDLGDHLVDDPPQVRLVGEARASSACSRPLALDPDVVRAVDHDLGDGLVREQALERPVPEDVVGDLADQALAIGARDRRSRARAARGCRRCTRSRMTTGFSRALNSCGPRSPITARWTRFLISANGSPAASCVGRPAAGQALLEVHQPLSSRSAARPLRFGRPADVHGRQRASNARAASGARPRDARRACPR